MAANVKPIKKIDIAKPTEAQKLTTSSTVKSSSDVEQVTLNLKNNSIIKMLQKKFSQNERILNNFREFSELKPEAEAHQKMRNALVSLAVLQPPTSTKENGMPKYSIPSTDWCADFASWVYKNVFLNNSTSAADILKYTSGSTGELMMHFYTADKPNLGFDYSNASWYKGKNPNIAFFYNDHSALYAGKNSSKIGSSTYIPKPGDFVFFEWNSNIHGAWQPNYINPQNGKQDHTGLVKDVITDDSGKVIGFETIEGNISGGNLGNGFKSRTIYFDPTNPNYSAKDLNDVIGYGTITHLPDELIK